MLPLFFPASRNSVPRSNLVKIGRSEKLKRNNVSEPRPPGPLSTVWNICYLPEREMLDCSWDSLPSFLEDYIDDPRDTIF